MSPTMLKIQYGILGSLSYLIPSLVLAAIIKYNLDINIPFLVFLTLPIYISALGIRYGNSIYRKILSHHITGWFIISLMSFFGGIILYEYPPSDLSANKVVVVMISLLVYFLGLFLGTRIGRAMASHDKTLDMDTKAHKLRFFPWVG